MIWISSGSSWMSCLGFVLLGPISLSSFYSFITWCWTSRLPSHCCCWPFQRRLEKGKGPSSRRQRKPSRRNPRSTAHRKESKLPSWDCFTQTVTGSTGTTPGLYLGSIGTLSMSIRTRTMKDNHVPDGSPLMALEGLQVKYPPQAPWMIQLYSDISIREMPCFIHYLFFE